MRSIRLWRIFLFFGIFPASFLLGGCASTGRTQMAGMPHGYVNYANYNEDDYKARLPQQISMGKEKVVIVDPNKNAWGAYDAQGQLVRAGIATAGGDKCDDEDRSCRTGVGTHRIYSSQGEECYSKIYPRPNGGGLMPYCMFFNNGEALHGSPDDIVVENNISHGCVRMRIQDAEWMYTQFAHIGTKVVVLPYDHPNAT